jgi:hypothetical protein
LRMDSAGRIADGADELGAARLDCTVEARFAAHNSLRVPVQGG